MKKTAFLNGRLLDPTTNTYDTTNILIANGVLTGLGYSDEDIKDAEVIDIKGCDILPGAIDSQVSIPGAFTDTGETLTNYIKTAISGGLTGAICTTPDDIESPEKAENIRFRCADLGFPNLSPLASLCNPTDSDTLNEYALLKTKGIAGVTSSTGGRHPMSMSNALKFSAKLKLPIVIRPHDPRLNPGGVIHDGAIAPTLGLKGIPRSAEESVVARDISLCEHTGGHIHFFPITTSGSVELIRSAKQRGVNVTCGTCPHYLILSDDDISISDPSTKYLPPLRTAADQASLIDGIKDGTIDVIGSDHFPAQLDDKRTDFQTAKYGAPGSELLIPLVFSTLSDSISKLALTAAITTKPRAIFGQKPPILSINTQPNFTIVDPKRTKISTSPPFLNRELSYTPIYTIVDGVVVPNEQT